MSDEMKPMTTPTHDPAIEQEAERMLHAALSRFGEPHDPVVVMSHLLIMTLLRELATLRRKANERAEIVSALPDSFFADRSLSERVLRMVREWQRVLTIQQRQEDQNEFAALAAPLSDDRLREIEERAAKAKRGPWWIEVPNETKLVCDDIPYLLAALRSRGGETISFCQRIIKLLGPDKSDEPMPMPNEPGFRERLTTDFRKFDDEMAALLADAKAFLEKAVPNA